MTRDSARPDASHVGEVAAIERVPHDSSDAVGHVRCYVCHGRVAYADRYCRTCGARLEDVRT